MQYEAEDTFSETKYYPPKKRFLEKAEMVRFYYTLIFIRLHNYCKKEDGYIILNFKSYLLISICLYNLLCIYKKKK